MAQIAFIQIDENNLVVGVHNEALNTSLLPNGHSVVEKLVDDPQGLLGLPDTQIDELLSKRIKLQNLDNATLLRNELRNISVELDLMVRLGEDTTTLEAEFDSKKTTYQSL